MDLTYDSLGSRLRAIGGVPITYGRMSIRPRTLGQWNLDYTFDNRLRAIGGIPITYGRMSTQPRALGQWILEYDRLGNRLRRIGPYEVGADWASNRLRTIGPLTIFYDWMGSRPSRIRLPDEYRPQWNGLLLALFLMLYQQMRASQNARRWAAGA